MVPLIGFAVGTAVLGGLACICWAWLTHAGNEDEQIHAFLGSMMFTALACVLLAVTAGLGADYYTQIGKGVCQEGLDAGIHQVQVVGEQDDMTRLIVAVENENDKDETSYQCRLVPASAFRTPPSYSIDFQTIEVVKSTGFGVITVVPTTKAQ